jgi:hypothetical protein
MKNLKSMKLFPDFLFIHVLHDLHGKTKTFKQLPEAHGMLNGSLG